MMRDTYYVVRTKRSGRFIRAFVNEHQARDWCDRHPQWFWRTENPHPPDDDGRVFRARWPRGVTEPA